MRRESEGKDVEDGKEKSERKRQREKQRRSELTNAFDDLSALVLKMDNGDEEGADGDGGRKKGRRMSSRSEGDNDTGGMTRVDLINRALGIMNRLHQENMELKQSLSRSNHDKGGEVMVMVPTLTPADDGALPPAAVGSFRPPYMPPGFPPLAQQDHGQPPPHYAAQPRYPPPQQGAWGPYAPPNHFGGSERSHRLPPPPPPPQMDMHDGRQIR